MCFSDVFEPAMVPKRQKNKQDMDIPEENHINMLVIRFIKKRLNYVSYI